MTIVTLPSINVTGANEWNDVEANDVAIQEVVNGELDNDNLRTDANIARTKLEASARGIVGQWYAPKVIATEETRENVAFGTLTTADELTGIVVPTNGLIRVRYAALVKSSVGSAGRVALFVGSNAISLGPASEQGTIGPTFRQIVTLPAGSEGPLGSYASETLSATGYAIGEVQVPMPAGNYTVSIRFRATSGSVTAKSRSLWASSEGI